MFLIKSNVMKRDILCYRVAVKRTTKQQESNFIPLFYHPFNRIANLLILEFITWLIRNRLGSRIVISLGQRSGQQVSSLQLLSRADCRQSWNVVRLFKFDFSCHQRCPRPSIRFTRWNVHFLLYFYLNASNISVTFFGGEFIRAHKNLKKKIEFRLDGSYHI